MENTASLQSATVNSKSKPRVLIADDHSMIRKGIKLFMQMNLNQEDINEVSSCNELMNELVRNDYTHLILDIILSDGSSLEVIPNITNLYPKLKILVFSMQPAEVYGQAMKQYGINNYLSKSIGEEDILSTLTAFINNDIEQQETDSKVAKDNPFSQLAPRELEILHYLLKGMRTKEIAETINLKMNTVSTLKTRIYTKTNVSNLKELLELAALYNVNF